MHLVLQHVLTKFYCISIFTRNLCGVEGIVRLDVLRSRKLRAPSKSNDRAWLHQLTVESEPVTFTRRKYFNNIRNKIHHKDSIIFFLFFFSKKYFILATLRNDNEISKHLRSCNIDNTEFLKSPKRFEVKLESEGKIQISQSVSRNNLTCLVGLFFIFAQIGSANVDVETSVFSQVVGMLE